MSLDFKGLMGSDSLGGGGGIIGQTAASTAGFDGCLPSLTLKQRVIGFVTCFCVGMIISFLSTLSITDPVRFAMLYTIGNIIALLSTAFLFGPIRQLKNMFARTRILATLIYLGALAGTLVVAIKTQSIPGVLIMIFIQFLALVWYTLSYIPFARQMVMNAVGGCFKG